MILFIIVIIFLICRIVFLLVYDYNMKKIKIIQDLRNDVSRIYPNIRNIKIYPGKNNFTRNKKIIYLRLSDKNNKPYNLNSLMYVLIHELAHCECSEFGHTAKFYELHSSLLQDAIKANIYNPNYPLDKNVCRI